MKIVAIAFLLTVLLAFTARADIIYFTDGLKTICQERAWEEDGQIKCEYNGWVINYQKSDVSRILHTTPPKRTEKPEKNPPAIEKKNAPAPDINQKASAGKGVTKKIPPPDVEGTKFYDPRRPNKYWTDKNSKHKTYGEAMQALAAKYGRPVDWIKANIGETNDLDQIHQNLSEAHMEPAVTGAKPSPAPQPAVEFYNPRRPYPYWTDGSTKHKSYNEAIQTLAKAYNRSPQWIKENMGNSNVLSEIHRNLSAGRPEKIYE